jgi:outer membrane protein OmpA-like peptidoglycan-associated protein
MLRFAFLGMAGALMLVAGCVPSGQYIEMRDKYREEAAKNRRLMEENQKLAAALRAKGVNIDDLRKELALISETGAGRGMGVPLTVPPGTEHMKPLPGGGLRMGEFNFRSGSAELTDKAKAALNEVAAQLKAKPGVILVVDGHTDTDPISKSSNASNWELSGKRAAAVADYLVKAGACRGEDAFLRGFGQFKPISDEKAQNRRVEIFAIRTPGAGGVPAKAGGAEEPVTPARPTPKPATKAAPKTTPPEPSPDDPSYK